MKEQANIDVLEVFIMLKKLISLCVSLAIFLSVFPISASAATTSSVDEILSNFHIEVHEALRNQKNTRTASGNTSSDLEAIRHETVEKLQKLGYEAYEVTGSNYDAVGDTLNTDFTTLGLSKGCSYIVVVGNDASNSQQTRSTIGNTFYYTYQGVKYTLRTIKITSADDSNYMQATSVDLLPNHTENVIQALLDATIGAYTALGVPTIFGTIASLTGLTRVNLGGQNATAIFHGGTTWTRHFTQVWDSNMSAWTYGSSVETATQVSYVNGLKYNATTDQYAQYTSTSKSVVTYSPNFGSPTWQNEKAIIGLLSAMPIFYDKTGDAYYTYNSSRVITHREGF
jgi:hypothetical protein